MLNIRKYLQSCQIYHFPLQSKIQNNMKGRSWVTIAIISPFFVVLKKNPSRSMIPKTVVKSLGGPARAEPTIGSSTIDSLSINFWASFFSRFDESLRRRCDKTIFQLQFSNNFFNITRNSLFFFQICENQPNIK